MMELIVGTGTCGVSAGADKVLARLRELQAAPDLDLRVSETGCAHLRGSGCWVT